MRACDLESRALSTPCTYCFVVQDSEGVEHEVTVEFSREATAAIQRGRLKPLSLESSFWINRAERSLATYLWEKDRLPPDGWLLLEEVCLDDLEVARHWNSD